MKDTLDLAKKEGFTGIAIYIRESQYQACCIKQNGHITGPVSAKHDLPEFAVEELGWILEGGKDMNPPWQRLRYYPREPK